MGETDRVRYRITAEGEDSRALRGALVDFVERSEIDHWRIEKDYLGGDDGDD